MENNSTQPTPIEKIDQIARSNKKAKQNINHLIFNSSNDADMIELEEQSAASPHHVINPVPSQNVPHGTTYRDLVNGTHLKGGFNSSLDMPTEDEESDDDEPPAGFEESEKCPAILLTKEEKKRIRQPWRNSLIIKMFDCKIGYMSLMKRLKRKWQLKGGLTLTDIGYDYFIARFSSVDD